MLHRIEKEVISSFLECYKNSECLWKTEHPEYHDKNAKIKALRELLRIFQQIQPEATIKDVKMKIQNFRTCFRRELRKKTDSEKGDAEEIYIPNLWYFPKLLFLTGADTEYVAPSTASLSPANEFEENMTDEPEESLEPTPVSVQTQCKSAAQPVIKKRKSDGFAMLMDALKSLNSSASKDETFGAYIAATLESMETKQGIYAKYLISQVLMLGELGELGRDTKIGKEVIEIKDC